PIWLFALGMTASTARMSARQARNRNNVVLLGFAIGCPTLHKCASLFQRIATAIGTLGLVASNVRKGSLGYFARKGRYLAAPVTERTSKAMNRDVVDFHAAQNHFHGHSAQRSARPLSRKNVLAGPGRV